MLDVCAIGDVFSAPNVEQMAATIRNFSTCAIAILCYSERGKKRNEVFDNTFYKSPPAKWPKEAQEVMDKAGL